MVERMKDKRTIVGVPFYDGESPNVLKACLKNIDSCLNNLGIDAKIIVGINGPRVSHGQIPISCQINKSQYNADVVFIKTPPGLVNAEKAIGRQAIKEGYERIFLTDADISRLPRSLSNMWEDGDRPIVGANYSAYPPGILIGFGIELTPQEIAFMKIFEADKHPLAREFTFPHRPQKRLKGSLLLVDTSVIQKMFGYQSITSDSRMNRVLSKSDRQLIPNAAFMHFARIDITDHIGARLRHFHAAAIENDLKEFSRKSLIYKPETANKIARQITKKYPEATDVASNFLLQCALRYLVVEICQAIVSERKYKPPFSITPSIEMDMTTTVTSFQEASKQIRNFLEHIDWESLNSPVTKGNGTTNNNQSRVPIDLEPFLKSEPYKKTILDYLGLDESAEI